MSTPDIITVCLWGVSSLTATVVNIYHMREELKKDKPDSFRIGTFVMSFFICLTPLVMVGVVILLFFGFIWLIMEGIPKLIIKLSGK